VLLAGSPLDASVALTVARVCGTGSLSLGVACWLARGDTQSRAAKGLVAAMLLYDSTVAIILIGRPRLWVAWCGAVAVRRSPLPDGHLVAV
jgi:hypothetical protein